MGTMAKNPKAQRMALICALFAEQLGVDPDEIQNDTDLPAAGVTDIKMLAVIEEFGRVSHIDILHPDFPGARTPAEFVEVLDKYLATLAVQR